MENRDKIFEIKNLTKVFPVNTGFGKKPASLYAVNNFTLDVDNGET